MLLSVAGVARRHFEDRRRALREESANRTVADKVATAQAHMRANAHFGKVVLNV